MRLKIKRISQRGVTLVELVIVLGLVIIISSDIIMLTNALNNLVRMNGSVYDNITNLTSTRQYIENWFYSFDEEGYNVSLDNWEYNDSLYTLDIKDSNFTISDSVNDYQLSVDNQNINVEYELGNTGVNTYKFTNLNNIKFEHYENTKLYKCIIYYDEESTFSFLLGRRSE